MKRIKSITTYQTIGNNECVKAEYLEYDANENLILSEKYNPEGVLIEKSEFAFNEKNQKVREKQYISPTEIAEEHEFIYNDNEQLSQIKRHFAERYNSLRTIEYHEDKLSRTELELDEDDTVEEKHIWRYENGNLVEQAEYDDCEKLVRKNLYAYDNNNRLIEETEFEKKDKKPLQSKLYTYYDDKNQVSDLKIFNRKRKIIEQYHFEYNESGQVIRQFSPISGSIEIEYLSGLNRIERNIDVNGNIMHEKQYFYDAENNLIKEETPLETTEYKIEYYD